MERSLIWRDLFAKWPDNLPQRGVLVTTFGEQIGFVRFLMSEHMLMAERLAPDSLGGRRVLIPYDRIEAVKITDPVKDDVFLAAGYVPGGTPGKKRASDTR